MRGDDRERRSQLSSFAQGSPQELPKATGLTMKANGG